MRMRRQQPDHKPKDAKGGPRIFSERERILWESLSWYIERHEGIITSLIDTSPIMFQCRMDNPMLAERLESMGYTVRPGGTTERLMPHTEMVTRAGSSAPVPVQHVAPVAVMVYSFALPPIG
jgi:hypothetical protein